MKLQEKIKNIIPVGYDAKEELMIFEGGLILSVLFGSGSFLMKLSNAISRLYWINGSKRILKNDAVMPHFTEILGNSLIFFAVLFIICLAFSYVHYYYHTWGSKSIYTMKRLPQKNEFSKRIFTLPLIMAVTVLALFLVTLGVLFAVYYFRTPETLIPLF